MDIAAPYCASHADLLLALPDRIAVVDHAGYIQVANAAFLAMLGMTSEQLVGRPLREIGDGGTLAALLERCLDLGRNVSEDLQDQDDQHADEARLFPHRDAAGQIIAVVLMIRDMTAVREIERRLLQAAAVYEASSQGVLIADARGRVVAVNAAFTRITGHAAGDLLGCCPTLLNSHWHPPSFFFGMVRRLLRQGEWQGDLWIRRRDGEIYAQRLSARCVRDARGRRVNFVGVFAEPGIPPDTPRRAEYLAHYDPLTRLPNRLLFDARLDHALARCLRRPGVTVLALLDLDRFEHINASLGHPIGDALLRAVGLRLRGLIRPDDTLARLGGNLFGLLFEGIHQANEIDGILRRLRAALHQPFPVEGHELFVTASIGVASTRDGDRETLMAHAEIALHLIKDRGRNGWHVYSDQPDNAATSRRHQLAHLRAALDRGDYELLYRPRVDSETGTWASAEASIQRNRSSGHAKSPPVHPPRLPRNPAASVAIGHWSLETACRQLRDWQTRGRPGLRLALPVAGPCLTHGDLPRTVERLLAHHALRGELLELEFDENLLPRYPEQIAAVFAELDQLGVGITLSGVGAGWIAPAALRRLPVDRLKIHPDFIARLPDSADDLAVVQAIIAVAQALELEVMADGVHTEEQRLLLLNLGCPVVAGELFAPPLPLTRFEYRLNDPPAPAAPRHN